MKDLADTIKKTGAILFLEGPENRTDGDPTFISDILKKDKLIVQTMYHLSSPLSNYSKLSLDHFFAPKLFKEYLKNPNKFGKVQNDNNSLWLFHYPQNISKLNKDTKKLENEELSLYTKKNLLEHRQYENLNKNYNKSNFIWCNFAQSNLFGGTTIIAPREALSETINKIKDNKENLYNLIEHFMINDFWQGFLQDQRKKYTNMKTIDLINEPKILSHHFQQSPKFHK